jgi:hypothetical protein
VRTALRFTFWAVVLVGSLYGYLLLITSVIPS